MFRQFFMVYVEGKQSPRAMHNRLEDAMVEAERLVRLPDNQDRVVFILQAVKSCHTAEPVPPVVWQEIM